MVDHLRLTPLSPKAQQPSIEERSDGLRAMEERSSEKAELADSIELLHKQ